jgi:hypothetical protein
MKNQSQHCLKWGKTETISSNIRNETKVSNLSTLIQYNARVLNYKNKEGKRKKMDIHRKGRIPIIHICR